MRRLMAEYTALVMARRGPPTLPALDSEAPRARAPSVAPRQPQCRPGRRQQRSAAYV